MFFEAQPVRLPANECDADEDKCSEGLTAGLQLFKAAFGTGHWEELPKEHQSPFQTVIL